jgi:glycosyltransferase involved in cell wall biosynthesis
MGVSNRTADVFDAVRSRHRKTVLFIASNADLDERYCQSAGFISLNGDKSDRCVSAIQSADVIVCQTDLQAELLKKRFHRDSYCFPNPFDYERWIEKLQSQQQLRAQIPPRYALWVGRSDRHHKRPELLIQVANLCPHIPFLMVMNTQDEVVAADVRRICPSNVQLIESVPLDDMPTYFQGAAMFVSTSSQDFEGFPNVFLQASATVIPIVSLEADPGFIVVENAGVVCQGDIERLADEVRTLWNNPVVAKQLGENGRQYVRRCHSSADSQSRMQEIMSAVLR